MPLNQEGPPMILLVDDDSDYAQALAKTLGRAGYRVSTAGDCRGALTILRDQSFDLIITDLHMPLNSGLDLLRSIRAISPEVPVVVITAFGEWTTYLQAMNSGAVDYLNKPVRRQDILMTIGKALARRGIWVPYYPSTNSDEAGGTAA